MRLIVIGLLVVSLLYYFAWEPFRRGYDRAYKVNLFMVVVISLILVPTGYMEYTWHKTEVKGSEIVREVSGKPEGKLKCQRLFNTMWDTNIMNAGYVNYDEPNTAHVKFKQCLQLREYFADPKIPTFEQTVAFNVLLHEAGHVGGNLNESDTECKALAIHQQQATALGTYPDQAFLNLRMYIDRVTPNMPAKYHSEDGCGGLHAKLGG